MTSGSFSKGIFLLLLLIVSTTIKAQLSANFISPLQSGCAPLIVKFGDQSTGTPTSWKWDLGNGTTSYLQNPSAIYFNPGKYSVKLVVKNLDGEDSIIKTDYIEVYSNPVINFSVNTTTGCYPLKVQFSDASTTSTGTINSWLWDFGDGSTATNQNPSHTFTTAKNFNISLQIRNSNGCVSTLTKSALIQINTGVLADFTNNNPHTCTAPVSINFLNSSTGTGSVQYLWDFGDNSTSTLLNPSHTYASNGTYSVKLVLVNNSGCKDTSVKINAVTVGSVKANLSSPDTVCQNMIAQMNNTSVPVPATVLWNFGDGTVSTQFNPTKKYISAGNYNIKMVANFGACTDSAVKSITVLPKPLANFVADNSSNCKAPFTVNFSSQGSGIQSYLWFFGDNSTSTLPNPTHTYNTYGSFTVKLIITNGNGCTDTIQKNNFIIIQKPKITTVNLPDSGCVPFTKNFNLSVNGLDPVTSYLWDFGDGSTSSSASPAHTYTSEAAFNVSVIITTGNGCTDTARITRAIATNIKPTPNFGASPLNTCAKTPVSFTDLSSAGDTKWLWNFGDTTYSTLKNPSHQYVDTGYFDVQLKIWKGGCSDSIKLTKHIHINPPVAKFTIASDCKKPFERVFTDNSIGADKWDWNFGDGTTSTLQNPAHIFSATGKFTITLKATNNTYGCDYSTSKNIEIINTKAYFVSKDTVICKGNSVVFTNNIPLNQVSSLNWDFGSGSFTSANANIVAPAYNATGSFTVRLILTDINGCKDTLTRINYINVSGPTAKFGTGSASICLNGALMLKDSSITDGIHSIQKWRWDYGDGKTDSSSAGPFQHLYSQAGSYIIKLKVTDNSGCTDSSKLIKPIIVSKPTADFNIIDSSSCPGKQMRFINQSTGTNLGYKWNFSDNTTDTSKNPNHSFPSDGLYSVTLAVLDQYGCSDSVAKQQFVKISSPTSNFITSDSISNCPPLVVNFSDSSTNVMSRKWDFGDSTFSTEINPTHFYNYPGTYFATLTITGKGGCTAVFQRRMIIKGPQGSFSYAPLGGCNPVTVNFIATTNNNNSVVWDFSDGNTLGTPTLTAANTYLYSGSYIPKMILIDPTGCKVPFPGKDTIKVSSVTASLSFNKKLLCDSGLVSFMDSSTAVNDVVNTYQWNFGDGTSSTSKNPNHQYSSTGIFYPKLIATSQFGCTDTVTALTPVSIVTSPKINITSTGNGCVPLVVTFNSQTLIPDTSVVSWQWDFANGNVSTSSNPVAQNYYSAGVYNVSLIGTNSSGCKTTVIKNTEAYAIPNVNAGSDTILCKGSSLTLRATGADNYSWTPSTSLSCTNCDNPATTTPNNISYFVTGTSIHGCSAKDTIAVNVKTKFILSHSASDSVCKGSSKKLTASGGDSYSWTPGNSLDKANISTPTAQPDTSTVYRVVAADNVGCFKDTGYIAIRVNPIPTVEAGIDKTINVGQTIDLVPVVSPDVIDVNWQPTTGLFRNFYPGITVKPKENTEYTVEVKNRGKCLAKDRVTVYVICNGSNIFVPNTFSPNGDGNNDVFYPRGTGVFKIKSLKIFNRWGEPVFERSSFDANNPSYGWDGTSRGVSISSDVFVYILEVICDNGSILTYNGNIALIK